MSGHSFALEAVLQEPKRTELSVRRERAILVGVLLPGEDHGGEEPLDELARLARTAGAHVVERLAQRLDRIDPHTYVGRGKAEELARLCAAVDADAILCDHDLRPSQIHALEAVSATKVLDRSELILDIFATRAKTRQAKVQVELAQLEYTFPRLTRMWSHLDRHGGGIGTRGPGERQLESDRRAMQRRMSEMRRELEHIALRKSREVAARRDEFKVCLVGYTNAGKSTLLNALTGAESFVEDRLFATLDTKTRVWELDGGRRVLLSDTVGFIRRLPHHLVASFHATLEEATEADLLLHVIDISHPDCLHQTETVIEALAEIGCADTPSLAAFNKIDVAHPTPEAELVAAVCPNHVRVSAIEGTGLDSLAARVGESIRSRETRVTVQCHAGNGRIQACLHRVGHVLSTERRDEQVVIEARVEPRHLPALHAAADDGDSVVVHAAPGEAS